MTTGVPYLIHPALGSIGGISPEIVREMEIVSHVADDLFLFVTFHETSGLLGAPGRTR